MKKYHQRPAFGVKSGSRSCTAYVEVRNSHEPPVTAKDMQSRKAMLARNVAVYFAKSIVWLLDFFASFAGLSVLSKSIGGSSKAG